MNLALKAWRMARIAREYRAGRVRLDSRPIRLWFDTCSACNLRCVMCPNKDLPPAEKGMMSLDLFRRVIDQAHPHVSDIYLHHRGEPLLNRHLPDMIRYARARGIRCRFHTNGALLTEDRARDLIAASPELVSFSIDGFEKDTYERIRVGADFDQTIVNVRRLLRLRREARQSLPYVVVERIRFRGETPAPEARERAERLRRDLLRDGVNEIVEKEEYVWAGDAPPDAPAAARTFTQCTFPWYAMVIGWNGVVTPCPQDFWGRLPMGDASRQPLADIWNGPAYQDLRRRLLHDLDSLPLCRRCDRLCRKTVTGLPAQYLVPFLVDHFVGYNKLRTWLGGGERNS
ncbi:MAG TPA: radical SAM/SPASM domain-containing protein [Kiritimatiellia bacterium]|nr:radical SAM/SPASM domain-containing protein [Kiritimatiellia bacterium]HRX05549.1 radical SAM/SPASM domain-containing protein [Kiritimatiellia bacterium]